jgi:hypothetical protein
MFMKINIMKIDGEWESGLVLDWHVDHSEFLGQKSTVIPNTILSEQKLVSPYIS